MGHFRVVLPSRHYAKMQHESVIANFCCILMSNVYSCNFQYSLALSSVLSITVYHFWHCEAAKSFSFILLTFYWHYQLFIIQ